MSMMGWDGGREERMFNLFNGPVGMALISNNGSCSSLIILQNPIKLFSLHTVFLILSLNYKGLLRKLNKNIQTQWNVKLCVSH